MIKPMLNDHDKYSTMVIIKPNAFIIKTNGNKFNTTVRACQGLEFQYKVNSTLTKYAYLSNKRQESFATAISIVIILFGHTILHRYKISRDRPMSLFYEFCRTNTLRLLFPVSRTRMDSL